MAGGEARYSDLDTLAAWSSEHHHEIRRHQNAYDGNATHE